MDDELALSFEFTQDDLHGMTKSIFVPWWMRALKWVAYLLATGVTLSLIFILTLLPGVSPANLAIPILALLFALVFLLAFEPTARGYLINRASGGLLGGDRNWTITPDRLSIRDKDGSEGSFEWSKVISVVESRDGFMLYTAPALVHWIPIRVLSSEGEKQLLRNWARDKVKAYIVKP